MDFKKMFEEYKEDFIEDLIEILRYESVSTGFNEQSEYPFGRNVYDTLVFMLEKGEKFGFRTGNIDNYAGYIEFGEGEEIGVLGHLDVVPAGSGWKTNPYDGVIIDDKIYGRGVLDDKGPTMAAYYAMKMLMKSGVKLNKRIRLILGTDEEEGMNCIKYYLTKEDEPAYGFAPDADFPLIYGEKGILQSDLFGLTKIKEFHAGSRYNVVPDFCKVTLDEDMRGEFIFFLDDHHEYLGDVVDDDPNSLVIYGKSSHAMEPDKGVNAALVMAEFLNIYYPEDPLVQLLNLIDSRGKKIAIDYTDDIMGPMTLNIGIVNADDGEFRVGFDMRYPKGYDNIDSFIEVVNEYGKYFEKEHMTPHYVDKDSEFVKTLLDAYQKHSGDYESQPKTIGGGTYARTLKNGVAFGCLFPGREETAHQKNEYMYLEDLYKAVIIYAEALYNLCK